MRHTWKLIASHELKRVFQLDDEPNHFIQSGWKSPNIHLVKFLRDHDLGPNFESFLEGIQWDPLYFAEKNLKRWVKYHTFHVAIFPSNQKKSTGLVLFFVFFFPGGKRQTTDPSSGVELLRFNGLRLHQRVGDVMPKLKVPSQPDVRCLLMWWKPGPTDRGDVFFFVGWVSVVFFFFCFF